jgi:wobble nucleotide-excising tRNase
VDLSWVNVVASGGSAAVAMTVMWFALGYIRDRDRDAKERDKQFGQQTEAKDKLIVDLLAVQRTEMQAQRLNFQQSLKNLFDSHQNEIQMVREGLRETTAAIVDLRQTLEEIREFSFRERK